YEVSAKEAQAAQHQLEGSGSTGQLALFTEATALTASGDYKGAIDIFSGLGANNDLIAEAGMNRAVAELRASDSNGARAELDRVLQSRDADSTALGMAY